jgi:hypothetical protein
MTTRRINICADHVWAGEGKLTQDGIIEDCPAIFGGSQDAAESIYDVIQDCIEDGEDSITVDGVLYTWTID